MSEEKRLAALRALLPEGRGGLLRWPEELASTNAALKKLAAAGAPAGSAVLAERQTAGRGRLGRRFESPPGGLYLSFLLRPEEAPEALGTVTARAAVAVRRAVGRCCGLWPEIKWVNDLQWQGRKLCGILCEAVLLGGRAESLVIGVGVNVHTPPEAFPPALRAKAASLGDFCRPPEKTRLAAELLLALDGLARQQPAERAAYWEEYRACCVTLGKTVTLPDGREALAEGLGEDFALLLRLPDGSRLRLQSGEATLHGE